MKRLAWGTFAVVCLLVAAGVRAETVEWARTPIPVTLRVGVERQVRFEGPATVGVPAELLERGALRAEFANDTAYWLATEPFAARRLRVRLERTGEFVLLDVEAVAGAGGAAEPLEVRVVRPEQDGVAPAQRSADDPRDGAVALIRDAARLDLAPPRLGVLPAGTVAVETARADAGALYRHPDRARMDLRVVGQLTRGGLFVTTLEAANRSPEPVAIDVRRLRPRAGSRRGTGGGFLAIGWTRATLAPTGAPGFTTRLYVVTRAPFDRAVAEAVR